MIKKMLRSWSTAIGKRASVPGRGLNKRVVRLNLERLEDRLTLDGSITVPPVAHPSGPDVWIYAGQPSGSAGGSSGSGTGVIVDGPPINGGSGNGSGIGDWDTASNWSLGVVPDSTNQAIFDPTIGSNLGSSCSSHPIVDQLDIVNGYSNTVTLNQGIVINNGAEITSGTIDQPIEGSTIEMVAGNATIDNTTINSTKAVGILLFDKDMTITIGGGYLLGARSGNDIENAGTITFKFLDNKDYTFTNNNVINNLSTGVINLQSGSIVATMPSGGVANQGIVQKTATSDATIGCLPIQNVAPNASLIVNSGNLSLQTMADETTSFYQSEGSVTLGLTTAAGQATSGTITAPQGFNMTSGTLTTRSIDDSKIDGITTISGGDIYIRADSATETGNLIVTGALAITGGDFHAKVNSVTDSADMIKGWGTVTISTNAVITPNFVVEIPPYGKAYVFLSGGTITGNFSPSNSDWTLPDNPTKGIIQLIFTGS